jgi:hypothetical protein
MRSSPVEIHYSEQLPPPMEEPNAIGAPALQTPRKRPDPDVDTPARPDPPNPCPPPDRRWGDVQPAVGPEGPGRGHPGGGSEEDD